MTTLLLLALLTAPGDPLALYVMQPEEPVAINTDERVKLGTSVKVVWPNIVKANLTTFGWHRPGGGVTARCAAGEETVPTDAELLTMVVAKQVSGAADKPHQADEVGLSVLAPFAEDAFGRDISEIYQVKTWRDLESQN